MKLQEHEILMFVYLEAHLNALGFGAEIIVNDMQNLPKQEKI